MQGVRWSEAEPSALLSIKPGAASHSSRMRSFSAWFGVGGRFFLAARMAELVYIHHLISLAKKDLASHAEVSCDGKVLGQPPGTLEDQSGLVRAPANQEGLASQNIRKLQLNCQIGIS